MTDPAAASGLGRVARLPFLPALTHLDARFAALFERLQHLETNVQQQTAENLQHRQEALVSFLNNWSTQQLQQLTELTERIHADAQAVTQNSAFVERTAETVAGLVDELDVTTPLAGNARRRDMLLRLLAHDGPLAESGLWFNPPVVLRNGAQGFEVDQVHERIVEIPFVFACLANLPAGAAVLDVGSGESTVALSLAALGHRTIALDQRGYPLCHPNLQVETANIAAWSGPAPHTLDAIVCLSTLEHLGLNAYGGGQQNPNLDRETIARFRTWLKPGGLLALTVPYGRPAVSDFERTYGPTQLDALLAGWTVKQRRILARNGTTNWEPHAASDGAWPDNLRGVALISAVPA